MGGVLERRNLIDSLSSVCAAICIFAHARMPDRRTIRLRKLVFLQPTGVQKSESLRAVKFGAWAIHLGALGVFVVPYEHSLLALAAIVFFIRTFAWEGGS